MRDSQCRVETESRSCVTGQGNNWTYTFDGLSVFSFAGYEVPGGGDDGSSPTDPLGQLDRELLGRERVHVAWFVTSIIPVAQVPKGTARGPNTTRVVG